MVALNRTGVNLDGSCRLCLRSDGMVLSSPWRAQPVPLSLVLYPPVVTPSFQPINFMLEVSQLFGISYLATI
ncbi:MAG: hypothetical protein QMC90_00155 [Dehalococcoidales bacterium]|nr:hypothetical protein [Dehalococcoidales bacterium]